MKNITHWLTSSKRHDDQLIKYIATIKSENANYSAPKLLSFSHKPKIRRRDRDSDGVSPPSRKMIY